MTKTKLIAWKYGLVPTDIMTAVLALQSHSNEIIFNSNAACENQEEVIMFIEPCYH